MCRSRDAFPDTLTLLLSQYASELQQALGQYTEEARGPVVHSVLAQTLLESVHATTTTSGAQVLAQFRTHLDALDAKCDTLERACDAADANATASTAAAADQKRGYETRLAAATTALSDLRARLRGELNAEKAVLERLRDELDMTTRKHAARVANTESDIAWTRSRTAELTKAEMEAHARPESEQIAVTRSILTKERSFHDEERSLLTHQRDLMDRVAHLEHTIARQTTAHVHRKLALETTLARQTGDAKAAHAEFARQLKAQTKRDVGALKLARATRTAAMERETEAVARECDELRAKLALLSSPVHRAAPTKKGNRDFFAAMSLSFPAVPVFPPSPEEAAADDGPGKRTARAASFLDVSTSSATLGPNTATRMAARNDSELCRQS